MSDKYRKCIKCGASAFQDPTLTFHSFPRAGKASNYARLGIWAEYCFANVSEEVLKSLHKSHKLLCSKHFDRSAYTDDTIKKLNGNAVPNVPGSPAERLQQHSISVDLSVPLEPPVSNVPILSLPADTSQQHLIPVSVLPPQPTVPNMPILVLPDPSQEPVVLESKQEQLKKCKKYLNKIYSLKRALKKKKNATKSRKCFVETLSGTDKYRKCVKCGASAFQDPTLTFHSFPRAGKASNYARLRIWAEYCFANVSEDVLKSLHKSHKLLCSRHFDRSAYTDDTMKKLNGNAVPNVPGSLAETLQQHSISVICRDSLRN